MHPHFSIVPNKTTISFQLSPDLQHHTASSLARGLQSRRGPLSIRLMLRGQLLDARYL